MLAVPGTAAAQTTPYGTKEISFREKFLSAAWTRAAHDGFLGADTET
jgi:hypothetical protein